MRLHHLNCISSCPLGGRLMDGRPGAVRLRGRLCCHCLLAETRDGLLLVDTGFGLGDVRQPRQRLSAFFLALLSPDFREEMTALRQVERLGFAATDVRHIVLTHLDFDHAGGLQDFPQARIHLLQRESEAARERRSWLDRQRYRPAQWGGTLPRWNPIDTGPGEGDRWFGFGAVRPIAALRDEVALVPLPGHTFGHAGVALRSEGRWVLLAGDAYFFHREMDLDDPACTPGLRLYQALMQKDGVQRLGNQQRLRELKAAQGSAVEVLCSHDGIEFERIAGRAMGEPVAAAATASTR